MAVPYYEPWCRYFGGQIPNMWSDTEFRPRIFGIPAGAGPLPIVWSRWRELEESPILVG